MTATQTFSVIFQFLDKLWPHIAAALTLLVSLLASGHAILNKRDTRSAVGWVGVIWLVPIIGSILYILLGINRIKRRARALRSGQTRYRLPPNMAHESRSTLEQGIPDSEQFIPLTRLVDGIIQNPLTQGNEVVPLVNGDTAFPAMIQAIDGAQHSVTLSTYIFDNDSAGKLFQRALADAVKRKVDVLVIIDDVGARYSLPPVTRILRRDGISVARFLPSLLPWRMPFFNLRNHRKILVVDGKTGFTGGMNIREGLLTGQNPRFPVQDIHFLLRGPVVAHLQEAFAEDWAFCAGELLQGEQWFPAPKACGPVIARGIPDGPDEDFEKLLWTLHGALSCAKSHVQIMTPYFLPDSGLIRALNVAATRGVRVDIVLPGVNNLTIIKWASTDLWWQMIEHGCNIWLTPPPFDHTKLMIVDGLWACFGSANWDPRSLRLNFEFNVECYDRTLAGELSDYFNCKMESADRVTLEKVNSRSLPAKLRDGVARLFSPYL